MNFSVHLNDKTFKTLSNLAKKSRKTRNSLVREAIDFFLSEKVSKSWPESVRKLPGSVKMRSFESYRNELTSPDDDPLK